jgi:hypothetical protein
LGVGPGVGIYKLEESKNKNKLFLHIFGIFADR